MRVVLVYIDFRKAFDVVTQQIIYHSALYTVLLWNKCKKNWLRQKLMANDTSKTAKITKGD